MTAIERLRITVRQQQAALETERQRRWDEIERLWQQCCQAEGLDIEAQQAVFRPENPYLAAYHAAITAYLPWGGKVMPRSSPFLSRQHPQLARN